LKTEALSQAISRLLRHHELIWMLTLDEWKRVYRGSFLGLAWVVVKPVLVVGFYAILFGTVFKIRDASKQSSAEYLLVLLTGLLPWLSFSEAVSSAASSITANRALVTKIIFPVEVLPISKVFGAMLSGLISLSLLIGIIVSFHHGNWIMALLPLLLLVQVLFTIGLAWLVSTLNVATRDTTQVLPFLLTGWMFLSPVIYTAEMVPKPLAVIFSYNPLSYFLDAYRSILLDYQTPTILMWVMMVLLATAVFCTGLWVISRTRALIVELV
jgi:lipopolysaccharide transport system permease protein